MNATPVQLIDSYLDNELDDAAAEPLRAWLEADENNVRIFVRHVYLHRQLRETLLADNVARSLEQSDALADEPTTLLSAAAPSRLSFSALSFPSLAMLLLLGAFLGSAVTWEIMSGVTPHDTIVVADPKGSAPSSSPRYVATLVNVTNCRWDQNRSTAELSLGSSVQPGDSLHLLEGVAEISSTLQNGGLADLRLEGPAAMTLNSNGMPSLLYGHLTGTFECRFDQFTLDTPLGLVRASGDASIGISAAANKVELHVFSGSAVLEPWSTGVDGAAKELTAAAGVSLSVRVDADGSISVDHGVAKEGAFLTPGAFAASQLNISTEYIDAIRAAEPLAYWRFEGDVDGLMRNEVADRLHCRMVGKAVRWRPGPKGSAVEFGVAAGSGYLISDETLDVQTENYSVELWTKPTCFHHGTLFSLIQWQEPRSPVGMHRMGLELCGPASWVNNPQRTTDFHPGRIRFIHECRPLFDVDCYSKNPYVVRQWQHIVAVKAAGQMHLYRDGQLVDSKEASGALPTGLRVLVGQLLPESSHIDNEITSRLFTGEMDEIAFYDRALRESEIQQHYNLVRPRTHSSSE